MSWPLVVFIVASLLFASLVAILIFAAYLQRLEARERANRLPRNPIPQNQNTENKEH